MNDGTEHLFFKPKAGKKKNRVLRNFIEIYHRIDEVCAFVSTLL